MIAAVYYFQPLLTGRQRFFRLGETAFWLIVPAFHVTFLAVHVAGLLGQRRRTWTYDAGQGWEVLNLVASVAAFVMAIGFALVILDVAINTFAGLRGRRNPWNATTLEWAAANPSPNYGFASIPIVDGRYPLSKDPDLPVRIAKGEGYLADFSRNRRETLIVTPHWRTIATRRATGELGPALPVGCGHQHVISCPALRCLHGCRSLLLWAS